MSVCAHRAAQDDERKPNNEGGNNLYFLILNPSYLTIFFNDYKHL